MWTSNMGHGMECHECGATVTRVQGLAVCQECGATIEPADTRVTDR